MCLDINVLKLQTQLAFKHIPTQFLSVFSCSTRPTSKRNF